jgi:hypothetical protein
MLHPRVMSKLFASFLLASLAGGGIHAQTQEGVFASPRITAAVDDSNLVTLQGNVYPLATVANDQGPAPGSLEVGRAILVLKNSPAQQVALNKLTDDQQNSKSPSYHAWLTPAEYGARFGVALQDIAKITSWLESHGFTVEPPMASHNVIMFSGTSAQISNAFHTEIHIYKVEGGSYTANASNPQIPAAFSNVIRSFSPNNFPVHAQHTTPKQIRRTDKGWKATPGLQPQINYNIDGSDYDAISPYDLATIYNILPLWNAGIDGTGQTIAIVSDSNIHSADVDAWRSMFGLPATKLNIINYGPDPGVNGDESEADLDVEWAGSVAKNATIDLVVANNSFASDGVLGAAEYAISNNLAPLLNVSYAACEQVFATATNQFINILWEQAASQGITVLVASGDAGAATCDRGNTVALNGNAVNGLASTPYDVAVGGTDFSGNFPAASKYWNSTNNPTTQASVISYIPESPWNDSCANPLILTAEQSLGNTTDPTLLTFCNDVTQQAYFLDTVGGGGGASNCAVTGPDLSHPCVSGYPKPAWQSGVNGIPSDGARDLPDVSLMAGNGEWGSLYLFCDTDYTQQPCSPTTGLGAAGGTSFASPIFAGMLALVMQKQGTALGNINYVLYKLGSTEYADASSTSCSSSTVATGNSCVFYDITQGSNATPCLVFSIDCDTGDQVNQIGILTGYSTTSGYDLASGLGSVNAYNLVEDWNSASSTFLPSTTTLDATSSTTSVYGQNINLKVVVAPVAPAAGVPSGDVGIITNDPALYSAALIDVTLNQGQGTVAALPVTAGSYLLFGNYAGDATFAPSTSGGIPVTITKAPAVTVLTSTVPSVQPGQNVTVSLAASGVLYGFAPTGTVVFTDTTTKATLPVETLPESSTFNGITTSTWFATVPQSQLPSGANTITATYSGDSNYLGSPAAPITVTAVQAAFTIASNQSSLTLSNGTGTMTVSVTPSGPTPLSPNSIVLSCPVTAAVTCSFSPNTVGSNGVLTSTLIVQLAPSAQTASAPAVPSHKTNLSNTTVAFSLAGLLLLMVPKRRRNYSMLSLSVAMLTGFMLVVGCNGAAPFPKVVQPSLISSSTTLSVNPVAPLLGGTAVFTATVTPTAGKGVPTGSITFSAGSAKLGTSVLKAGSATFSTTSLPLGSQAVIAIYSGDSNYSSSSSAVTMLNVSSALALTITAADGQGDQSSVNVAIIVD